MRVGLHPRQFDDVFPTCSCASIALSFVDLADPGIAPAIVRSIVSAALA